MKTAGAIRLLALLVLCCVGGLARAASPDIRLTGVITRGDFQTWKEIPFRVPSGVGGLRISFDYDTRDQHTVIDLGLADPHGFRGWSGGNKPMVFVGQSSATPSYSAGPIPAGDWRLVLGVPNIRPGVVAHWTATVRMQAGEGVGRYSDTPLRSGPGWYRGDLHMHTAHSDGSCAGSSGASVPCPVFRSLAAAADRGLDFVAVSDHNTLSQDQPLRELQPLFDRTLLIPAEEVTTFHGHLGVIGPDRWIDFRLAQGPAGLRNLGAEIARSGFAVINHPALPSGETCMGCGWSWPAALSGQDAGQAGEAVEVVNGRFAWGPLSGLAFWETQLNAGRHRVGVGGSDSHDGGETVGKPATVVWADDLSQDAILRGLRSGRVFIDVEGVPGRWLDLRAGETPMGGTLATCEISPRFVVRLSLPGRSGARLSITADGKRLEASQLLDLSGADPTDLPPGDTRVAFRPAPGAVRLWLRADIVNEAGHPLLIGNPIYLRRSTRCVAEAEPR